MQANGSVNELGKHISTNFSLQLSESKL